MVKRLLDGEKIVKIIGKKGQGNTLHPLMALIIMIIVIVILTAFSGPKIINLVGKYNQEMDAKLMGTKSSSQTYSAYQAFSDTDESYLNNIVERINSFESSSEPCLRTVTPTEQDIRIQNSAKSENSYIAFNLRNQEVFRDTITNKQVFVMAGSESNGVVTFAKQLGSNSQVSLLTASSLKIFNGNKIASLPILIDEK